MLSINGIKKGVVIDHIKQGVGVSIFNFLALDKANYRVALIMNVPSVKMGLKDIIKIENEIEIDLDILGLIDPNITINIIEDEVVKKKFKPHIPNKIENIVKCKNPRCVTSIEKNINHKFILVSKKDQEYRCDFCDEIIKIQNLL
ncbi:MAG: aspartate carbamoyltransferase regulatory subunit [Tenericutes bacterium]|nr:aspartate carbamoyltransferase regulatory subunit [Mycoplasmatota bacterium]